MTSTTTTFMMNSPWSQVVRSLRKTFLKCYEMHSMLFLASSLSLGKRIAMNHPTWP